MDLCCQSCNRILVYRDYYRRVITSIPYSLVELPKGKYLICDSCKNIPDLQKEIERRTQIYAERYLGDKFIDVKVLGYTLNDNTQD